jgi:hypothetical protein
LLIDEAGDLAIVSSREPTREPAAVRGGEFVIVLPSLSKRPEALG